MKNLIFGICLAGGLLSCGPPPPPPDPDLTCDASPAAATLATNVQPVFAAKCSATCHRAMDPYGDYTTAAMTATIVGKTSLWGGPMATATLKVVDPQSLANSALWLKVLGGAATGRVGPKGENVSGKMPNDTGTLTPAEQKILKDWICGGAK